MFKFFEFKKYPHDFIVEEKLFDKPGNKGHVLYVMFEKKNKNTFDILDFLGKNLNLKRKHFGIAGLKDKFGITRQWISIYKRTVNSRGGVNNFINTLAKQSRILQIKWGNQLLKMGDNKGNLFFIRLRRKSLRKQGIKLKNEKFIQIVEKALNKIKEDGFPNLFGSQRFGRFNDNPKIGKKLILDKTHIKNELEAQFKVQAYASWLFNKYVLLREELNLLNKAIEGDIFVKLDKENIFSIKKWNKDFLITGPLYGRNLVINSDFEIQNNKVKFKQLSYATKLELKILSQEGFDINILDKFKKFNVKGLRRPILVYPKDLRWKWDKNRGDLLLMFELPSGSYASILVEYLEKLIKKELEENSY